MSKSVQFLAAICMLAVGVCFAGSQANASVCFLPDGGCNLGGGDGMGGDALGGGVTCSGSTTKPTPKECYDCDSCVNDAGQTLYNNCHIKDDYEVVDGQCQRVGQCPKGYTKDDCVGNKEEYDTQSNGCHKCRCKEGYKPDESDNCVLAQCPDDYPETTDKTSLGFKCEKHSDFNCWNCYCPEGYEPDESGNCKCPDDYPYTSNPDENQYNCQPHSKAKGCYQCARKTEGCSEYKIINNKSTSWGSDDGNVPIGMCLADSAVADRYSGVCQCGKEKITDGWGEDGIVVGAAYYLKCNDDGGTAADGTPIVVSALDNTTCSAVMQQCESEGYTFEKPDNPQDIMVRDLGNGDVGYYRVDESNHSHDDANDVTYVKNAFAEHKITEDKIKSFFEYVNSASRTLFTSGSVVSMPDAYLVYTTPKEVCPHQVDDCTICTSKPYKYNACVSTELTGFINGTVVLGGEVVNVGELRPNETAFGGHHGGTLIVGYSSQGTAASSRTVKLTYCFCPDGYYDSEDECKEHADSYEDEFGFFYDGECTSEEFDVGYPDGTKVECYRPLTQEEFNNSSELDPINGCGPNFEDSGKNTNALYAMNNGTGCELEVYSTMDGVAFDRYEYVEPGRHEVCTFIYARKSGTPVAPSECDFSPSILRHVVFDVNSEENVAVTSTYNLNDRALCSSFNVGNSAYNVYAEQSGVPIHQLGDRIGCGTGTFGYQLRSCSPGYSLTTKFGGTTSTDNSRPDQYHLEYDPVNPKCVKWVNN